MNTELKLQFRQTMSDCLHYMVEPGRDKNEILTVMNKLEKAVTDIINVELHEIITNAPKYQMLPNDRVLFGTRVAMTLEYIATPDRSPQTIVEMIKGFENFIEICAEKAAKGLVEKPKMRVSRMKDLPN
jgi:hypothetical protein